MEILGLHHVTAIARDAKLNHYFYTDILGQRLVKKTVNFDDPQTYHLYYSDQFGTPGTVLTFFPWEHINRGTKGTGLATDVAYTVPIGALTFWKSHLSKHNIPVLDEGLRFSEKFLCLQDYDGLRITFIETDDSRTLWKSPKIDAAFATRGFHSVTLSLKQTKRTADVLSNVLGFKEQGVEANRLRFKINTVSSANIVDLEELPTTARPTHAGGTIHHVAFRVKNEDDLISFRDKISAFGLNVTEKIDRNYFFSIYFREPGGVLFELATDNPGFTVDEDINHLGENLKLPSQYESIRVELQKILPEL